MLALEHKAYLDYYGDGSQVIVKAQPFGGGVQILDHDELLTITGDFNYDSQRSRVERDLRIFMQPSRWEELRDFCIQIVKPDEARTLESDPTRELQEEFFDALRIEIQPTHYSVEYAGTVVEDVPVPTRNLRSAGSPTARIYFIYEVQIHSPGLIELMMRDSDTNTAPVLRERVKEDAGKGGKGRANAVLAVPLEKIKEIYCALPEAIRAEPLDYGGTLMDGNVVAILGGVPVPKYKRDG